MIGGKGKRCSAGQAAGQLAPVPHTICVNFIRQFVAPVLLVLPPTRARPSRPILPSGGAFLQIHMCSCIYLPRRSLSAHLVVGCVQVHQEEAPVAVRRLSCLPPAALREGRVGATVAATLTGRERGALVRRLQRQREGGRLDVQQNAASYVEHNIRGWRGEKAVAGCGRPEKHGASHACQRARCHC